MRHSDPSHALLEILFVCTANPVLRDRLHMIRLDGYDEHEKLQIAKRYLVFNALRKCGLGADNVHIGDDVIAALTKSRRRQKRRSRCRYRWSRM